MGVVVVMKKNMPNAIDKDARLSQIGFNIGDYIDICATFNWLTIYAWYTNNTYGYCEDNYANVYMYWYHYKSIGI